MSKENATAFVQAVLNDEELREKTANLKPEEAVPLGKEMGYDFTLEEFTDVMNEDRELSPDELEAAAGGENKVQDTMRQQAQTRGYHPDRFKEMQQWQAQKAIYCPDGNLHQYVDTIVDKEVFFGAWSTTFFVRTCCLCGYKTQQEIHFGDNGEISFG